MGGLEGSRAAFWVQEGQASTARGASQVHSNVQSLDTTPGVDGMYTLLCAGFASLDRAIGPPNETFPIPTSPLISGVSGAGKQQAACVSFLQLQKDRPLKSGRQVVIGPEQWLHFLSTPTV